MAANAGTSAFSRRVGLILGAALVLTALLWKAYLLALNVFPFNSDEAIVALMARHILQGERPIFFYGQAYMGSLDAFLVAGGFALFGEQVWVIRLVQALLYAGTIIATVLIGKVALGSLKQGLAAGAILAIPAVNTTLYTTASLGGYGEALLLGVLSMLTALVYLRPETSGRLRLLYLFLFALLSGLGLWANALSLVFSVPSGLAILLQWMRAMRSWRWWVKNVLILASGFVIGSLPWWIYAVQHGPQQLVTELLGTAVAVETEPWILQVGSHLLNYGLFGLTALLGLRPPWSVDWLAVLLIPFALAFWGLAAGYLARRLKKADPQRTVYGVLVGVILIQALVFLFTSFGVDPSGRYFIPLMIPLSLAAGGMLLNGVKRRSIQLGLLGLVLAFQGWGTLQCAFTNPPGITTQFSPPMRVNMQDIDALAAFLEQAGIQRGYTNYWVAYPLAFLSKENLIFVPRLPYHADFSYTSRDDRYSPYDELVSQASQMAYITTNHPELDQRIRQGLQGIGVGWSEKKLGDFQVFYQLSRPVRPIELGLGD